ncbi:MAG: hypothetical protein AB8U25_06340 [Rickettsiales endosymbiont of Dermacentor nuttalli]
MILNRRFSKLIIISVTLSQILSKHSKVKVHANIPLSFEYPRRVVGIREVEIRAQVSGNIVENKLPRRS